MNFSFETTPRIIFGNGSSHALGEHAGLDFKRPIFLTDKGLISAGLVDKPIHDLKAVGADVLLYDNIVADPPASKINEAVDAARQHDADSVIGFGGGSSMDTAKVVAVLLKAKQTLEDIYGIGAVEDKRAPLLLAPTTAGTGSEVTPISVVTKDDDTKVAVVDSALFPDIAVLDPTLTLGLPRNVTAATGIDAMVHAVEAYTNINKKNPVSDALAREALSLLASNIVEACENGSNLTARENMMLGAMLAGQSFANSPVGAVHAMAYPLGGIFHIPHGLSNSLMLEPVLRFNAPNAFEHYAELAEILIPGISGTPTERCDKFIHHIVELVEATGVERRLSQMGISHNDLPRMAEDALKGQRLLQNNPRPVNYDDALNMYQAVL